MCHTTSDNATLEHGWPNLRKLTFDLIDDENVDETFSHEETDHERNGFPRIEGVTLQIRRFQLATKPLPGGRHFEGHVTKMDSKWWMLFIKLLVFAYSVASQKVEDNGKPCTYFGKCD